MWKHNACKYTHLSRAIRPPETILCPKSDSYLGHFTRQVKRNHNNTFRYHSRNETKRNEAVMRLNCSWRCKDQRDTLLQYLRHMRKNTRRNCIFVNSEAEPQSDAGATQMSVEVRWRSHLRPPAWRHSGIQNGGVEFESLLVVVAKAVG